MTLDREPDKAESTSSRLKREVDSWRSYAGALRQEDREVFRDMINVIALDYSEAVGLADRGYDTEAVMMSILLSQQKMINSLSNLAKRIRRDESQS